MSMRTLVPTAFAAVLLLAPARAALAQEAASADAAFRATTLSLSASGEVKATPDMATITLGVQTEAPTAQAAMAQNAGRMSRITAALRAQGLAGEDIQTSDISLSARYDYQQNQPPKLRGYQASNTVSITVHDVARLGRTLDAVTAAGANEISGVGFGLKDPGAAENQARLKAVQALQAKAQLYAGATGYKVARLVNLSEGGGYVPQPPRPLAMRAGYAKAETPVEAGELTVRIDVTGMYELAPDSKP
jgi:uncharacterized protein YggE